MSSTVFPWWAWLIIILVIILIIILIWWLVTRKNKKTTPLPAATPAAPQQPDDLTLIEGVGPKISQLLMNAGIQTYQQLAESDTVYLEKLLSDAGMRLAKPETWAQQAKLAADQKWDALKELQDNLKGGRLE